MWDREHLNPSLGNDPLLPAPAAGVLVLVTHVQPGRSRNRGPVELPPQLRSARAHPHPVVSTG